MPEDSDRWWYTEYADDIYNSLRKKELERLEYWNRSPQIEWRLHFVNIIQNVAQQHNLLINTVHSAVYFLDLFMDNHQIDEERMHLVALTATWMAAKIEETNFKKPKIQHLNTIREYPKEDYLTLEIIMLNFFQWNVNIPTVSTFCEYFIEFVADDDDFRCNNHNFQHLSDMKQALVAKVMIFLDLILLDHALLYETYPSKLAAICIAAARYTISVEPMWSVNLMRIAKYSSDEIVNDIQRLLLLQTMPELDVKELQSKHTQPFSFPYKQLCTFLQ